VAEEAKSKRLLHRSSTVSHQYQPGVMCLQANKFFPTLPHSADRGSEIYLSLILKKISVASASSAQSVFAILPLMPGNIRTGPPL